MLLGGVRTAIVRTVGKRSFSEKQQRKAERLRAVDYVVFNQVC
jgi:hypothetical protein